MEKWACVESISFGNLLKVFNRGLLSMSFGSDKNNEEH